MDLRQRFGAGRDQLVELALLDVRVRHAGPVAGETRHGRDRSSILRVDAQDADLLVLDGNPLDDVGNLTRVAAVLMGGERVV